MVRQRARRIAWCAAALFIALSAVGQPPSAQTPGWTFTASSDVIDAGQSTTLTFSTATTDLHSVTINGLRPTYKCGVDSCTGTLSVRPFLTTTYELRSTTATGVPWPVQTVVVTVIPAPPTPLPPTLDASQTRDIATLPLLSQANLVYEGAFKLPWNDGTGRTGGADPDGWQDNYSFRYGAKGIGFDKSRGSLFVSGEERGRRVAEIAVPEIRIAATPGELATASVLQPLADPTDGRYGLAYPGGLTAEYGRWGQFLPYKDKLLISVYHYYDSNWIQNASHFVSSLNLARPNDAIGPFKIGGDTLEGFISDADLQAAIASKKRTPTTTGFTSGYMGEIPQAWQTALGGKVIAGQAGVSIVGRTSFGPGAFAFDPDTLTGDQVPIPLVYYPIGFPTLGPWGGPGPNARMPPNPVFNGSTQVNGVVFPVNTRTVIFLGRHGLGAFCYGATCRPEECQQPKCVQRNHAPPYVYYAWLYDAAEFLKVRRGEIKPWDVKPYSVFALDLPFRESEAFLKGAAYDPATGRIFISQDRNNEPVIHVYRIR